MSSRAQPAGVLPQMSSKQSWPGDRAHPLRPSSGVPHLLGGFPGPPSGGLQAGGPDFYYNDLASISPAV